MIHLRFYGTVKNELVYSYEINYNSIRPNIIIKGHGFIEDILIG
jgi:hypothetical protein